MKKMKKQNPPTNDINCGTKAGCAAHRVRNEILCQKCRAWLKPQLDEATKKFLAKQEASAATRKRRKARDGAFYAEQERRRNPRQAAIIKEAWKQFSLENPRGKKHGQIVKLQPE